MKKTGKAPAQSTEQHTDSAAAVSPSASTQDLLGNSAMNEMLTNNSAFGDRFSYGAQTYCDLDHRYWSSDLKTKVALQHDLPVAQLGKGVPKVRYFSDYHSLGPGMKQIVDAHEQVHVDNAMAYSQAFKKQVDDSGSGWILGIAGEETISTSDYMDAYRDNFGGLHPSCEADEKMAYARSVEVAEQLLADQSYADEHELIRLNLGHFEAQTEQPTTCGSS